MFRLATMYQWLNVFLTFKKGTVVFSPSGSGHIFLRQLDPEAEGTRILQTV
jgi:hypothetical protein